MHKNRFAGLITLGIIFLSLITTGCGEKPEWGDIDSGLILNYRIPEGQTLTYKTSTNSDRAVEAMGQSISTKITSGSSYSINSTGVDDQKNLMLKITINDISFALNSPQANINADTSGLKGKSFEAVHSPNGRQLKVTGVEDLPKIVLAPGSEQNVKDSFEDILPALPDTPVKTGESWSTPIDRTVDQGQITVILKGETTSVLEGLETIQEMECVKIKSQTTATIEGSGTQMGQAISLKGDITETSVWYFAYKKGILVKSTSDVNENTKVNLGAMEIPQISKSKVELELVL